MQYLTSHFALRLNGHLKLAAVYDSSLSKVSAFQVTLTLHVLLVVISETELSSSKYSSKT